MEVEHNFVEDVLSNNDAMKEFKDSPNQSEATKDCCQDVALTLNLGSQIHVKSNNSQQVEFKDEFKEADGTKECDSPNKDQKRRKSRTRRTKYRRRRPYYKLSFEERRHLEEQNQNGKGNHLSARTIQLQYGKPFAPYNTTQFLMDDHNVREPDFEEIHKLLHYNHNSGPRRRCQSESANTEINDGSSSDEFYSSPDDEHDFIQKQFSETYENIHAERLNSMSKSELVQEYLLLEERIEELERKLGQSHAEQFNEESCRSTSNEMDDSHSDTMDQPVNITVRLEEEIRRLREENERLHSSNEMLQCILKTKDGVESLLQGRKPDEEAAHASSHQRR